LPVGGFQFLDGAAQAALFVRVVWASLSRSRAQAKKTPRLAPNDTDALAAAKQVTKHPAICLLLCKK